MPYYCYILECADGTYYTGWSVDPQKRLLVHNTGNGARYTRTHRPTRLVYVEEMPDRSSALKRELVIKHMDHAHKSKLIELACATPEETTVSAS